MQKAHRLKNSSSLAAVVPVQLPLEQHPRQLHEMDLAEYLETKHAEIVRQETGRLLGTQAN